MPRKHPRKPPEWFLNNPPGEGMAGALGESFQIAMKRLDDDRFGASPGESPRQSLKSMFGQERAKTAVDGLVSAAMNGMQHKLYSRPSPADTRDYFAAIADAADQLRSYLGDEWTSEWVATHWPERLGGYEEITAAALPSFVEAVAEGARSAAESHDPRGKRVSPDRPEYYSIADSICWHSMITKMLPFSPSEYPDGDAVAVFMLACRIGEVTCPSPESAGKYIAAARSKIQAEFPDDIE